MATGARCRRGRPSPLRHRAAPRADPLRPRAALLPPRRRRTPPPPRRTSLAGAAPPQLSRPASVLLVVLAGDRAPATAPACTTPALSGEPLAPDPAYLPPVTSNSGSYSNVGGLGFRVIWISDLDSVDFLPETLIILHTLTHHNFITVAPIRACSISKCSSQ